MNVPNHYDDHDKPGCSRNEIATRQGWFSYDDPAGDIDIEDIAVSLSRVPRYMGHTSGFYSVAQHSLAVSRLAQSEDLSTEIQFIALMHDASEAYCGDIPRPLKHQLDDYQAVEKRVEQAIADWFGYQYPYPEVVHRLDENVYLFERRGISSHADIDVSEVPSPPPAVTQTLADYWRPNKAWNEFLSRYKLLQQ